MQSHQPTDDEGLADIRHLERWGCGSTDSVTEPISARALQEIDDSTRI